MAKIIHHGDENKLNKVYVLPYSKSISNRVLVLNYLYEMDMEIQNISSAHDTFILQNMLTKPLPAVIDAEDAGTVMRFMTAVAATAEGHQRLIGIERMYQRPIQGLVESLQNIGTDIEYLGNAGYPPLRVGTLSEGTESWQVASGLSSQYVTAMMMIMPTMGHTTTLEILGDPVSVPYIHMTSELMNRLGFDIKINEKTITYTPSTPLINEVFACPSDYSALAYPMLELSAADGKMHISGLSAPDGLQGDEAVLDFCTYLGLEYQWKEQDLILTKSGNLPTKVVDQIFDFSDIPDLALPMVVGLCIENEEIAIRGISTLDMKESERWEILQDIVYTLGFKVFKKEDYFLIKKVQDAFKILDINDHYDHRVVMTLASISHLFEKTIIHHPESVRKSFPAYWSYFEA